MLAWKLTGNFVLTTELKRKLTTVKSLKADVLSVSPMSEQLGKSYCMKIIWNCTEKLLLVPPRNEKVNNAMSL